MEEPIYAERQNFHTGFYLILLATGVLGMFLALPSEALGAQGVRGLVGFLMLLVSAVSVNILAMTTRVLSGEVVIHFGRVFFFYTKSIAVSDIRSVSVIDYHPIRESGGWGIRWGEHEGRRARYFSARGDRAVAIETDDDFYIVGTEDPEGLAEAIGEALAGQQMAS